MLQRQTGSQAGGTFATFLPYERWGNLTVILLWAHLTAYEPRPLLVQPRIVLTRKQYRSSFSSRTIRGEPPSIEDQ